MGTKANIRVYQTVEHPCGYWPERQARDLVLDPVDPMLPGLYGPSLAMGFRRSGSHVYRPHCAACQACTPVRIPVERFRASLFAFNHSMLALFEDVGEVQVNERGMGQIEIDVELPCDRERGLADALRAAAKGLVRLRP